MTRDVVDLIDHAVRDWETSGDAMRWTPEPPQVEPRRTPERPIGGRGFSADRVIVDEAYAHPTRECLFVGGPWHGRRVDIRRHAGPLPERLNVFERPTIDITTFADHSPRYLEWPVAIYDLRRYAHNPFGANDWPMYCAPGVTYADVIRAVNGLPAEGQP